LPGKLNRISVVLLISGTALLLSACVQLRLLTYPSNFTWIDKEDVQSNMHIMAYSLHNVDVLVSNEDVYGSNQAAIVEELSNIEYQAALLSARTPGFANDSEQLPATNHLLIDEHMEEFLQRVYNAMVQAEANPPSYFGAGQLTGSCSACHRYR